MSTTSADRLRLWALAGAILACAALNLWGCVLAGLVALVMEEWP